MSSATSTNGPHARPAASRSRIQRRVAIGLVAGLAAVANSSADEPSTPAPLVAGQVTAIAASAGRLRPERAVSTSATLWLGGRIVPDLDAYLSPELAAAAFATISAGGQIIVSPGADGRRAPISLLWLRVHLER